MCAFIKLLHCDRGAAVQEIVIQTSSTSSLKQNNRLSKKAESASNVLWLEGCIKLEDTLSTGSSLESKYILEDNDGN